MLAPTAARSASMRSSSASRATAASSGYSTVEPPSATIRAMRWALGEALDADEEQVAQGVGESRAAALVGGDGEFSTKNALPSERSKMSSTWAGSGSWARMLTI